jgi:hypothetical protein
MRDMNTRLHSCGPRIKAQSMIERQNLQDNSRLKTFRKIWSPLKFGDVSESDGLNDLG